MSEEKMEMDGRYKEDVRFGRWHGYEIPLDETRKVFLGRNPDDGSYRVTLTSRANSVTDFGMTHEAMVALAALYNFLTPLEPPRTGGEDCGVGGWANDAIHNSASRSLLRKLYQHRVYSRFCRACSQPSLPPPTEGPILMSPEINNREAIEMMNRCKHEILSLRAQINSLQPKADAYDNLVTVLRLLPRPSIGMGEDLVWVLDKRIRELQPKPEVNQS